MSGAERVIIVGGGRMGAGIAHAFLATGSNVEVRDIDEDALKRSRFAIRTSLERAATASGGADDVDGVLERLSTVVGLSRFGDVDLLVETVPEIPDLKRSVLEQVSTKISATAVLASNTSSIAISELAASVVRPGRFIGMHFFNPVPVSRLVEIVRGRETEDETVAAVRDWAQAIGKETIVVNDSPGFATSRLGLVIGLEAIRMLEEGVATAEDIDAGMVLGYSFPVGPLRLTDIVGLDVRLEIAQYLEKQLGERFSPPRLLQHMVAEGKLGRKSGQGFYEWPGGR